jgi:transcription antitermination protein NusB
MFRRSRAREVALQVLCQRDANRAEDPAFVGQFLSQRLQDQPTREYAQKLIAGVAEKSTEIDRLLTEAAENWRLPRMANVDRNVLRLGACELLAKDADVPPPVVLDESIELARRYGSAESPAFVNGVLDRVLKSLGGD